METKIITVILFFFGIVLFSSCSTESTVDVQEKQTSSIVELQKNIADYNSNFLQTNNTRGFFSFFKKICKVIVSDASGAIIGSKIGGVEGAIIVGVASSIITGFDEFSVNSTNISLDLGVTGSEIGKIHNTVIQKLYGKYSNLEKMSRRELFDVLCDEVYDNLDILKKGTVASERVSFELYNECLDKVSFCLKEDELNKMMSLLVQNEVFSVDEASFFEQYVVNILSVKSNKTILSYASGFSSIVNTSNISDDLKNAILISTSVAVNSRLLWKQK